MTSKIEPWESLTLLHAATGQIIEIRVSAADLPRIRARKSRLVIRADGRPEFVDGGRGTRLLHRWLLTPHGMALPRWVHADHRNGRPTDCRRENLRLLSPRLNRLNSSRFTHLLGQILGITHRRATGRWIVAPSLRVGSHCPVKKPTLGVFNSREAAEAFAHQVVSDYEDGLLAQIEKIYDALGWEPRPVTPRWADLKAPAHPMPSAPKRWNGLAA